MSTARQRTLAEVRAAGPKQVSEWLRAGELDELRAGRDPVSGPEIDAPMHRLLAGLSPDERARAMDDADVLRELSYEKRDAAEQRAAEEPEEPAAPVAGSADLGARGDLPQGQLSRTDLQGMSATAIVRAHREGRLDAAKRGEA